MPVVLLASALRSDPRFLYIFINASKHTKLILSISVRVAYTCD